MKHLLLVVAMTALSCSASAETAVIYTSKGYGDNISVDMASVDHAGDTVSAMFIYEKPGKPDETRSHRVRIVKKDCAAGFGTFEVQLKESGPWNNWGTWKKPKAPMYAIMQDVNVEFLCKYAK